MLVLLLALLATSGPAVAAPQRITGKLSKPGFIVIALADNGEAKAVRTRRGRFTLRPPAELVTLHLRAADGKYAGPIVVGGGGRGRQAIVGVKAGARLGRISMRRGYGRVARRLSARSIDRRRRARARRGVPIGAGTYGRVRSRGLRASRAGDDSDLDGVPGALDIDDDGDLVLDNLERSSRARAAQAEQPGAPLYLQSELFLRLHETANANASPSLTVGDVDAALRTFGRLSMDIVPGASVELDCGGLSYCSSGGSGRKAFFEPTGPFPDAFDDDRDGFGSLTEPFFLLPGVGSDEIGTGDVLIERASNAEGVETGAFANTLQFVFATVPALVSYSDTAGHSATTSYPVAAPTPNCPPPGCPPGGPGTEGNGFPLAAGPGGDIVLTLTFWRPQREAIAGDECLLEDPPCKWVDIGGLVHSAGLGCVPELPEADNCALKHCPPGSFSTPAGSELTPATFGPEPKGGLADSAPARAASAMNAFTYTVNVSDCLRDPRGFGVVTRPIPWAAGQEREFFFMATDLVGGAIQNVYFKLE